MTGIEAVYSFCASSLFPSSIALTTFFMNVRILDRIATFLLRDFSEVRALFRAEAIFAKIIPLCRLCVRAPYYAFFAIKCQLKTLEFSLN